jgi:hypothetical protein
VRHHAQQSYHFSTVSFFNSFMKFPWIIPAGFNVLLWHSHTPTLAHNYNLLCFIISVNKTVLSIKSYNCPRVRTET